jgi:hypothetical protein
VTEVTSAAGSGAYCVRTVNNALTGDCVMTAALKFLSQMTDSIFASRMQRAAVKISARERVFYRHTV